MVYDYINLAVVKVADVRRIFKEHFRSIIPDNNKVDKALR